MPDSFFATKTRKRKRVGFKDSGPSSSKKVSKTSNGRVSVTKKRRARATDEDLNSDEALDDMDLRADEVDPNESGDEDADETPAEKRLRLAKLYLESVREGLADGEVDAAEIDKELISARLKQDVLEHAGKLHLFVADSFDVSRPPPTLRTRGHRLSVTSAVASSEAGFLFTCGKEGSIIKWDLRTGTRLATFPKLRPGGGKGKEKAMIVETPGHSDEVLALALSDDGKYLASAGKDRRVCVWDAEKGEWVKGFGGHRDTISAIAFRKGTQQLYTASYDRTIKLFDLSVMGYVETMFGHQDCILHLDALRAETAVSVGGRDKTVRFWKIVDQTQLVFRGGGRSSVRELLEGGGLADVDEEGDQDGGRRRGQSEKKCVEGSLECVAMIDETTFLSGGDSGSICLWTTQRKKPIFTQAIAHGFTETISETEGVIRTPRWITTLGALYYSDMFASGSWDGHIRLWKVDPKIKSFSAMGSFPVPGVINSLQLLSLRDGSLDEAPWAWPHARHARADANRRASAPSMRKSGPVLLVAAVGQEPRLGRWVSVKGGGSQNCTFLMALHPRNR
ncbi:WD40 repeat-like protein [Russula earlei]|uniref:WD40 repeat-like protein n=1 Tax=Russula earlei TaxID=71964 RepID=A0ACC0UP59_9AGAM|nr:WD40 repeat-like protein [Russula earlei]